jgi:hypothetical protein
MTTTSDFIYSDAANGEGMHLVDGGRMIMRGIKRLIGVALVMAAVGLWAAPGASWESDVMLFKLGLSVSAALAGLCMMKASAKPKRARF